ncbi:MAG: hypothetical protein HY738_10635, partial [Bacteroidia bacterium]|nr:hypothetical protein [Bacteroidia bacterium]
MNNAEKYLFKDFTFKEYRELLEIASQNYIFRNFTNFQENENFIIWRHDVDFSLINAWELAKIEKEYNIKSTFFILLHSEFYNPLEYNSYKMLNEIKNSGHDIGLHFDSHFYKADSIECIEKYL